MTLIQVPCQQRQSGSIRVDTQNPQSTIDGTAASLNQNNLNMQLATLPYCDQITLWDEVKYFASQNPLITGVVVIGVLYFIFKK